MTSFSLKIIAVFSMLIDHIGALFFPDILVLRVIGRMAFPIFAFLIVEGAIHTSNIKRYINRIGLFALLSEIPFDLAMRGRVFDPTYMNVLVTFVIGLFCIAVMEKAFLRFGVNTLAYATGTAAFAAGALAAEWLHTDYGMYGIALIYVFYVFRERMSAKCVLAALIFSMISLVQMFAVAALIPIWFYNGKKGCKNRLIQFAFYVFYPLHLLILYLL